VKRRVVLNRARSEVADSQTNIILPSTSEEDRTIVSRLLKNRLRVTNCEHLKVGDDDEMFAKSVDRHLEVHLRETRS